MADLHSSQARIARSAFWIGVLAAVSLLACSTEVTKSSRSDATGTGSDVVGSADGSVDGSGVGSDTIGGFETLDPSQNKAPTQPSIEISPASPTTADVIVVTIVEEATDPDSAPEPISYVARWFKDDAETNHNTLTIPTAVTRRGEVWRVEVRAHDGLGYSDPVSASVDIVNSPPAIDTVGLEPAAPALDEPLVCKPGQRSDPDGDEVSLRFAWFVDGQLSEVTAGALSPPLVANVPYRCEVTPFDGAETGTPVSSPEVVPAKDIGPVSEAILIISPKSVDMGTVLPGETNEETIVLRNIGTGDLDISATELGGDDVFSIAFETPLTLAPNAETTATISFSTNEPGLHKGSVEFLSNASNPEASDVPLIGLGAAPCLIANPTIADFGGVYLTTNNLVNIEFTSCGVLPVSINSIALDAPQDTPFELDLAPGPSQTFPWVLEPGATAKIRMAYAPSVASPVDDNDIPIPSTATLSILSSSASPPMKIPVKGFASAVGCPVAVIDVVEGLTVAPGTLLHVDGTHSFAPGGLPSVFTWGINPPPGVDDLSLQPSAGAPQVTYQTSAVGTYEFQLKVFDEKCSACPEGDCCTFEIVPGCNTAVVDVLASDAVPLIVEVLWDTPGDPNQNDTGPGRGADFDLHMHNGTGAGPDYDGDGLPDSWFDEEADCFWLDTTPDWGLANDDSDDPELVREDADGAGPERIEYALPRAGDAYTVGVHYWSAFEYGPSIATVRIYIFEQLVAQYTDVVLNDGDFWEVATVSWPKGEVVQAVGGSGGPKITAGYPNPFQ